VKDGWNEIEEGSIAPGYSYPKGRKKKVPKIEF